MFGVCLQCTGTCGEGVRTRQINCFRRRVQSGKLILTTDKNCRHLHDEALRLVESCKLEPCKDRGPSWYASPWSRVCCILNALKILQLC